MKIKRAPNSWQPHIGDVIGYKTGKAGAIGVNVSVNINTDYISYGVKFLYFYGVDKMIYSANNLYYYHLEYGERTNWLIYDTD